MEKDKMYSEAQKSLHYATHYATEPVLFDNEGAMKVFCMLLTW